MTTAEFLMTVEPIVHKYNGTVTSWIRSEKRNGKVGGHRNSRHLYGWAVDVVLDDIKNNPAFIEECERQRLIAIDEGDHIHVQTK